MIEDKSTFNRFSQAFVLQLKVLYGASIKITKAREALSKSLNYSSHNQLLSNLPVLIEDFQDSGTLINLAKVLQEKHGIDLKSDISKLMQSTIDAYKAMPDDLAKTSFKADQTTYSITRSYVDYPDVIIAKGIDIGLRTFLLEARMVADLFPDEEVRFIGQDVDNGLPILVMLLGGVVAVSLQIPSVSDGEIIENGRAVKKAGKNLPGLDIGMPPQDIAYRLSQMYSVLDHNERLDRVARAARSMAALMLSRDGVQDLMKSEEESECKVKGTSFDERELLKAIDSIRLMYGATARITG